MKNNKAFTLVELIVVITILAILGTIAFISLQGYSADARDSTRVSDTGSMKKTLELYQLRESKYPEPDLGGEVSYSGNLLWTQGIFGEEVVKNLGKLISEAPLDPLTDTNYIYSLANNKKEYEILAIYEGGELANNQILSKVNADTFSPKISGNYNGVYLKTDSFIFPTPTIITSLEVPTDSGITMTATDLKSQVVTGGGNLPKVGEKIEQVTGSLENLDLNVYDGVIDSSSTPAEKIAAMEAIQNTYSGSTLLSNMEEISYVLSANTNEKKEAMIDIVVLDNGKILSEESNTSKNLSLTHVSGNKKFTFSSVDLNLGSCKLQYYKNGSVWTDINLVVYDCDSDILNQLVDLPGDGWNDEWNNIDIRIVNTDNINLLKKFSEKLTCSTVSSNTTSTPEVDEDCNGVWNNSSVVSGCTGNQKCWGMSFWSWGRGSCTGGASFVWPSYNDSRCHEDYSECGVWDPGRRYAKGVEIDKSHCSSKNTTIYY